MVAIKPQQARSFLARPGDTYRAILLHGTDPGLVSERAGMLADALGQASSEPVDIIRLDDGDMEADPDRPVVEARTLGLFGGLKIIRIKAGARLRPQVVDALLEPGTLTGFVIVEAGNLKRDSKLRKQFEAAKHAAAIACYGDDDRSLGEMIDEIMNASGLRITRPARERLASMLGADRALSRSELDKLALYCLEGSVVDVEDVEAIVGDAMELALDRIVFAAVSAKAAEALFEFERYQTAGQSPQSVLFALERHLTQMHRVLTAVEGGKTLEASIKGLRPPIHFKQVRAFTGQCQSWSLVAIERAVFGVTRATKQSRLIPSLEAELVATLLLDVARLAGRRRSSQQS